MPITVDCTQCHVRLKVRDEHAGKHAKCPKCGALIPIPIVASADPEPVMEVQPVEVPATFSAAAGGAVRVPSPRGQMIDCPECGERISATSRQCKFCKAWLDDEDEEDDRPRRKSRGRSDSGYKRCPECGARGASRVAFTWWGGFIGPMILCHVQCPRCSHCYNGRSGKSNTTNIIIYSVVGAAIGLAAAALWVIAEVLAGG